MQDTPHDLNRQLAQEAHDFSRKAVLAMHQSTIQYGVEAIRTAALVNGGAVVAMLAFEASIFKDKEQLALSLAPSIGIFLLGVILSGSASGTAYASQAFYERAESRVQLYFEHPFRRSTPQSKVCRRWALFFQIATIALVILAYLAIITGATLTWWALHGMENPFPSSRALNVLGITIGAVGFLILTVQLVMTTWKLREATIKQLTLEQSKVGKRFVHPNEAFLLSSEIVDAYNEGLQEKIAASIRSMEAEKSILNIHFIMISVGAALVLGGTLLQLAAAWFG